MVRFRAANKTAIKHVFDILKTDDKPIDGIGHRVVQGGWYFQSLLSRRRWVLAQVRELLHLLSSCYAEADVIEFAVSSSQRSAM